MCKLPPASSDNGEFPKNAHENSQVAKMNTLVKPQYPTEQGNKNLLQQKQWFSHQTLDTLDNIIVFLLWWIWKSKPKFKYILSHEVSNIFTFNFSEKKQRCQVFKETFCDINAGWRHKADKKLAHVLWTNYSQKNQRIKKIFKKFLSNLIFQNLWSHPFSYAMNIGFLRRKELRFFLNKSKFCLNFDISFFQKSRAQNVSTSSVPSPLKSKT